MTLGITKSPVALVTTGAVLVPRESLTSVTVAPGITAPCASLTVPTTEPVVSCAIAGSAAVISTANAMTQILVLRMRLIIELSSSSIARTDDLDSRWRDASTVQGTDKPRVFP